MSSVNVMAHCHKGDAVQTTVDKSDSGRTALDIKFGEEWLVVFGLPREALESLAAQIVDFFAAEDAADKEAPKP